jgi:hypothetical protein
MGKPQPVFYQWSELHRAYNESEEPCEERHSQCAEERICGDKSQGGQ